MEDFRLDDDEALTNTSPVTAAEVSVPPLDEIESGVQFIELLEVCGFLLNLVLLEIL